MDRPASTINEENTVAELAVEVAHGNRHAEEHLFQVCTSRLIRRLSCQLPQQDAEDIAQDAAIILLQRLRKNNLNEPAHAYSFLVGVANNLRIALIRKKTRQKTNPDSELTENAVDESMDPRVTCEAISTQKRLRELIGMLPVERDRYLLLGYFIQQKDRSTMMDQLNLSASQFSRVLHRSMQRLGELAAMSW